MPLAWISAIIGASARARSSARADATLQAASRASGVAIELTPAPKRTQHCTTLAARGPSCTPRSRRLGRLESASGCRQIPRAASRGEPSQSLPVPQPLTGSARRPDA
jgi:hypothetical protein